MLSYCVYSQLVCFMDEMDYTCIIIFNICENGGSDRLSKVHNIKWVILSFAVCAKKDLNLLIFFNILSDK